jgi:hypothetical protein
MNETYWFFNTDEAEAEGEGAHLEMIAHSRIAAWGYCRGTGACATLDRPEEGETIFFYQAGHGIIASGEVVGRAFRADTVFGQDGEYHRNINNLRVLACPLTVAEVRENTGYQLPFRHIVCRLNHPNGVRFIREHFENLPPTQG